MECNVIKKILTGAMFVLFLFISSSLFAISFDEPRKVIIPQYANAVYRDLTVLDKIYFEKASGSNRTFLLELGKRPSYFQDANKRFYLYENLKLKLDPAQITYNASDSNQNILRISSMTLGGGAFISENAFLDTGSTVIINNSSSTLLANYKGNLLVNLSLGQDSNTYNIYSSSSTQYIQGLVNDNDSMHKVDNLYLRDVMFGSIAFRSNRAMIHYASSQYKSTGVATNFELYVPKKPISNSVVARAKSYYGPWEVHNSGILTVSNPCGNSLDNLCKKLLYTVDPSKGETHVDVPDTVTEEFECANQKYSNGSESGYYDYAFPEGYCYDYQEKILRNPDSNNDPTLLYNSNEAYYEFKVEEIYSINGNSATLLAQTPNITAGGATQLSTYSSGSWTFTTGATTDIHFFVNGADISAVTRKILTDSNDDHPCFTICSGKLCTTNYIYLRKVDSRELKGGSSSASNHWPASDGNKQHLVLHNYTLGFCRKNNGTSTSYNTYGSYENNIGTRSSLIEGLLIKAKTNGSIVSPTSSSGSWRDPRICIKRLVKCNTINEIGYNRSYTLLSTDN